eukprot:8371_1
MLPQKRRHKKHHNDLTYPILITVFNDQNKCNYSLTDSNNVATLHNLKKQFDKLSDDSLQYINNHTNPLLDLFHNKHFVENARCALIRCQSLLRIKKVLQNYNEFINVQQQSQNIHIANVYHGEYDHTYTYANLLNDFNHLLSKHQHQFEDIHNILNDESYDQNGCNLSQCLLIRRNWRDRSVETDRKLYFNNDSYGIIRQQLIDRIHCYYMHSFDIGHSITINEQNEIIENVNELKNDEQIADSGLVRDVIVTRLSNLIYTKRIICENISGLQRLQMNNSKFVSEGIEPEPTDDWHIVTASDYCGEYSYGYRFFYWDFYRRNMATIDPFDDLHEEIEGELEDWYIDSKYKNLKFELTQNQIFSISRNALFNLVMKAIGHRDTVMVRSMQCKRKNAQIYGFANGTNDLISLNHILSIMVYCNYDFIQKSFSETLRKNHPSETINQLKKRHSHYFHLGKYLRECVECFGMEWTDKDCYFNVYHGISTQCEFPSLNAFIKGPISTTMDLAVAVNFCHNIGMILDMSIHTFNWKYRDQFESGYTVVSQLFCFDCRFWSTFVSEQEIFSIGGARRFIFNTIIDGSSGVNYCRYVHGLKQMTYCMTNGEPIGKNTNKIAHTCAERQMVFRLLSHELNRCDVNHPLAHEFANCPTRIKY